MPLAEANLVIHFPAILSRMPLVEANLVIHFPAILSRMPLFTLNMIFIIIAFTRRILNCICANRRENHAPALPISRPPLTEDPIPVAPPES